MKNISFEKKPLAIEIQTVSFCNSGCIICPYRSVAGKLPHGRMSMDLFMRILDQVEDNKAIRIIPYFNNEPFLDPLIFKRLRYICTTHPSVEIELSTNVSRLNEKYQNELAAYHIHDLRLSVFGFTDSIPAITLLHPVFAISSTSSSSSERSRRSCENQVGIFIFSSIILFKSFLILALLAEKLSS